MNDPRATLARPDLADRRLEGLIAAERYAETHAMRCRAPSAAIREAPDTASEQRDQLLFGEGFEVLEGAGGWAWGQARRDGYVGYVEAEALAPSGDPPTHRVRALRTIGFSRPDSKSPPLAFLSMNALVRAGVAESGFVQTGHAGWVFERHLKPIGVFETDPGLVAEAFLGAPYLWGGRESIGIDCSGLVQQALYACGRACPRDTDQQEAVFSTETARDALRRGDLVFWPGHVGMMLDGERLIHANGHHMATAVESLDEAVSRIRAAGGGEPAFRRP